MAKQPRKNHRGHRVGPSRRSTSSRDSVRTSSGTTSDSRDSVELSTATTGDFYCAILTPDELHRIIEAFATCLERSISDESAKCSIYERGKDGTYSLSIVVTLPPPRRCAVNSLSVVTDSASS